MANNSMLFYILLLASTCLFNVIRATVCPGNSNCDCESSQNNELDIRCYSVTNLTRITNMFWRYPQTRNIGTLSLLGCNVTVLPDKSFQMTTMNVLETDCPFSDITDHALTHLTSLQTLSLSNTQFKTLPSGICNLSKIEELVLDKHRLEGLIGMCDFTELRHLSVLSGTLQTVDNASLSLATNLISLDLSSNVISWIHENAFDNLKSLKEIVLRRNQLQSVDGLFDNLNPEVIDIHDNNITTLEKAFHLDMTRLKELYVGKNPMYNITSQDFVDKMPNLEKLDISWSSRTEYDPFLLRSMPHLRELYLGYNLMEQLPDGFFLGQLQLERIDMQFCYLFKANNVFVDLPNLKFLILNSNSIRNFKLVTLKNLPELAELILSRNKLFIIPDFIFSKFPKLQKLDLSQNEISHLNPNSFANLKNLELLDLSNNVLTNLNYSIKNLTRLRVLDVRRNNLKYILPNELEALPNLSSLNLAENYIYSLNGSFRNLINLKQLNLDNNKLTVLSRGNFPETMRLKNLVLAGNKWTCDCNMQWLIYGLVEEMLQLEDHPVCARPFVFSGIFVEDLTTFNLSANIEGCPELCNCSCSSSCLSNPVIVNCSHRGLLEIPDTMPSQVRLLNLNDNLISDVYFLGNYSNRNIVDLFLSNNHIGNFNSSVPPSIQNLTLNSNNITRFWPSSLEDVTNLRSISLAGNPWICDCETLPFKSWLTAERNKVMDLDFISCNNGDLHGKKMVDLSDAEICPNSKQSNGWIIPLTAVLITEILLLFCCCCCCSFTGKAWLYSKGLKFLKREKFDDGNKMYEYDALLVFAREDKELVVDAIIEGVNARCPGYSIYAPGRSEEHDPSSGFVHNSLIGSLGLYKRVIIVESMNFYSSHFLIQFLQNILALDRAVRSKLIFIQYRPLPDTLENSVIGVIQNCIIWEERLFWEKLLFLMPKLNNINPEISSSDDFSAFISQ